MKLVLMVGFPYAGKTTALKDMALSTQFAIVSPDAVRLALHGQRFVPSAEPMVWSIAKVMVRALFLAGHETVVIDATNNTRKRRDEWRQWMAREDGDVVVCCWHVFELVGICVERATAAGDAEIIPTIRRMAAEFEPLGDDEMRW